MSMAQALRDFSPPPSPPPPPPLLSFLFVDGNVISQPEPAPPPAVMPPVRMDHISLEP